MISPRRGSSSPYLVLAAVVLLPALALFGLWRFAAGRDGETVESLPPTTVDGGSSRPDTSPRHSVALVPPSPRADRSGPQRWELRQCGQHVCGHPRRNVVPRRPTRRRRGRLAQSRPAGDPGEQSEADRRRRGAGGARTRPRIHHRGSRWSGQRWRGGRRPLSRRGRRPGTDDERLPGRDDQWLPRAQCHVARRPRGFDRRRGDHEHRGQHRRRRFALRRRVLPPQLARGHPRHRGWSAGRPVGERRPLLHRRLAGRQRPECGGGRRAWAATRGARDHDWRRGLDGRGAG